MQQEVTTDSNKKSVYGSVIVLPELTLTNLNVNVSDLRPGMHTKVYVQCSQCMEVFTREFTNIHKLHACTHRGPTETNECPVRLECKLIHPDAQMPFRQRTTDAGYDIYSIEEKTIPPGGLIDLHTGIIIAAPPGYYFTVEGRSGMMRNGVTPCRGIIDATYCGELMVGLMNISDKPYQIKVHDRIAQIIMHRQIHMDFIEVEDFGPNYNQRGTAGYGASGR